jgi:hypothetical protein
MVCCSETSVDFQRMELFLTIAVRTSDPTLCPHVVFCNRPTSVVSFLFVFFCFFFSAHFENAQIVRYVTSSRLRLKCVWKICLQTSSEINPTNAVKYSRAIIRVSMEFDVRRFGDCLHLRNQGLVWWVSHPRVVFVPIKWLSGVSAVRAEIAEGHSFGVNQRCRNYC